MHFQKKYLRYYEVMGMNKKEYVKKVLKRIPLQKNDKTRLEEDLLQDILSAMEDGESWENIQKRMGTPEQVAQEYCMQIGCSMKKRRKWPWILLGIIIVAAVGIWVLIPKNYPLQSSKYFDEKEVETWNKAVVENISNKNIDKILSNSSEAFRNEVSEDELLTYFEDMNTGKFVRISQIESVENRSLLQGTFAVSEVTAQYDNRSVIYLISFDTDGKLAGLYMR